MTEKIFTPDEAAKFLGVHPRTIRRWLRDGELQGVKYGRLWRIRESDLLKRKKQPE
jgi:acetyl-CoA synthetase